MSIKRGGSVMGDALREEVTNDPEYQVCMLSGYHVCEGRLTNEHALYYDKKKIQKKFAIVKVCASGHGVDQYQDAPTELPKDMREWVALSRATDEEIRSISKAVNYTQRLKYLEGKYGVYVPPAAPSIVGMDFAAPDSKDRTAILYSARSFGKRSKLEEFERETRAYARTNRCSVEEAREFLMTLA